MDTLSIAFFLMTIAAGSFAALAERQRRIAKRTQAQLDIVASRQAGRIKQAHQDGLFEGWRRGWGECYAAALKAERQGLLASEAVRQKGRQNAPALLAEEEQLAV